MSNNPFATHSPQNVLNPFNPNPADRFPSIEIPGREQPQAPAAAGYNAGYMPPQQTGYMPPSPQPAHGGSGFQPSTVFGQSLQAQVNQYAHVQDLDPYGSIPNSWQQQQQSLQPPRSPQPAPPSPSPSSHGAHPRTIIANSKEALERWDPAAWRSFHSRIDELTQAWEKRKSSVLSALDGQHGRPLAPEEVARFQSLLSEAEEKVDLLTASGLQIKEVEEGYRHSSDGPSRNRVRQALNEAVRAWPDWPEELYTGPSQAPPSSYPSPYPYQPASMQPQYTGVPSPQPQLAPMQSPYVTGMQPQYTGAPSPYMNQGTPASYYPAGWNAI